MNLGQGRRIRAHRHTILRHLLTIDNILAEGKNHILSGHEKKMRKLKNVHDLNLPWAIRIEDQLSPYVSPHGAKKEPVRYANLYHLANSTREAVTALARIQNETENLEEERSLDKAYATIGAAHPDVDRIAWILERRKRRQWPQYSVMTYGADILTVRILAALALKKLEYQISGGTTSAQIDKLRFRKVLAKTREDQVELARKELEKIISSYLATEEINLHYQIIDSDIPNLAGLVLNVRYGKVDVTTRHRSDLQWINTQSLGYFNDLPHSYRHEIVGKKIEDVIQHPLTDGTGARITLGENLIAPLPGVKIELDWDSEENLIPLRIKIPKEPA